MDSHKVHGKQHQNPPAYMHMNARILSHVYGCFCSWRTCRLPNGIAARHWTVTNTLYSTMKHKTQYLFAQDCTLYTANHKLSLCKPTNVLKKWQHFLQQANIFNIHFLPQICQSVSLQIVKHCIKICKWKFWHWNTMHRLCSLTGECSQSNIALLCTIQNTSLELYSIKNSVTKSTSRVHMYNMVNMSILKYNKMSLIYICLFFIRIITK